MTQLYYTTYINNWVELEPVLTKSAQSLICIGHEAEACYIDAAKVEATQIKLIHSL